MLYRARDSLAVKQGPRIGERSAGARRLIRGATQTK